MKTISLFPLPSSVFYPGTVLPLHIFEDRYRQMVGDAIESGQWIGMVLLLPGYEENYYGQPGIVPVGCAGSLDQWIRHDDGKYDIVLRGRSRFRIIREVGNTPYRQAEVELLKDFNDQKADLAAEPLHGLIGRFLEFTRRLPENNAQKVEIDLKDCSTLGEAVDRIHYFFDQSLSDQQKYLEELDVRKRLQQVQKLLDLKQFLAQQSMRFSKEGFDSRLN